MTLDAAGSIAGEIQSTDASSAGLGGGSGREAETGMDVAKRGDGSRSRNGKGTVGYGTGSR